MDFSNSPLVEWFENAVDVIVANKGVALAILTAVLIGIASFTGYFFYKKGAQREAHKSLVAALKVFDAPVTKVVPKDGSLYFSTEEEKWKEAAFQFNQGYKKHASSTLAAAFLVFHSDALINLGERAEAIRSLTEAVAIMPNKQIKGMYELKLALMMLDNGDKRGYEQLQKIAFDQKHVANDQGLYHLGQYLWINKKYDEAKNFWQQFIVKYGNEQSLESLVRTVRANLDLVAV